MVAGTKRAAAVGARAGFGGVGGGGRGMLSGARRSWGYLGSRKGHHLQDIFSKGGRVLNSVRVRILAN